MSGKTQSWYIIMPYSQIWCGHNMKPGRYVLDLLKENSASGRIILYIRHSKRDSFMGVPEHLRHGVEITPEGVKMALEFGNSLQEIFPGRRLVLGHTTARRCQMTAEFISRGFSTECSQIIDFQEKIEDPILNMDSYVNLRDEKGWQNLIIQWLNQQVPEDIMQDPDIYADTHVKRLLAFDNIDDESLFVVIGHDYTLFPIISSVLGKKVTGIDFLNGIVINANSERNEIMFSDEDCKVRRVLEY